MDRRTAARRIATVLIAQRAREGVYEAGPITVDRSVIEEYVKEYTEKWGVPFDERMERELHKYGVNIKPSE